MQDWACGTLCICQIASVERVLHVMVMYKELVLHVMVMYNERVLHVMVWYNSKPAETLPPQDS